ncbi:CAP domain-containing protein [Lactobacillus sp. Sy-1]|uniref:CAP domain-containing protein n=1 Tax=Lactobacillus sp. Sy-1 TaxID=2109645 RepID=UPI001C5B0845|nr:CAP domain-containing protein [Lactobacillus sp. Sy-1]MBW1606451.1 CAP domain-containing protein [Lactobacillus sp. Sy-1]
MKISNYIIISALATSLMILPNQIVSAKDTEYRLNTNHATIYLSLPKGKQTFKQVQSFPYVNEKGSIIKINKIITFRNVKYARTTKNWIKLSELTKYKTNSKKKVVYKTKGSNVTSLINWNDSSNINNAVQYAFNYLNKCRTNAGVKPLNMNSQLQIVAQKRSEQIMTNFSHNDTNGENGYDSVEKELGITTHFGISGENLATFLASGNKSVKSVGEQGIKLFQSEGPYKKDGQEHGHYENDLFEAYTDVGIGFSYNAKNGLGYLVVDFGGNDLSSLFSNSDNTTNNN